MDSFVCVHNRDRDSYQVARALQEAGMLECLVTDLYVSRKFRAFMPKRFHKRYNSAVPAGSTASSYHVFAIQYIGRLLKIPDQTIFSYCNAALARKAGRLARERKANIYAYANYVPDLSVALKGSKSILFEYHPLQAYVYPILYNDFERFPEVEYSFKHELDSRAPNPENTVRSLSWAQVDAVVAASSMTARSVVAAGCDPQKISIIPYGCNMAPSSLMGIARSGAEYRLEYLFVGQGVQRKGLHHLIRAWKMAGLGDCRLTVVAYKMDPGIMALIDMPNIRVLQWISDEELRELYNASDIFVMPSLVEGFGLVYLEALSHGCYAIGTSNTGLPDLNLPDNVAGINEPGNIDALADSLHSIYSRFRKGEIRREEIVKEVSQWSWQRFRNKIAEHAKHVLNQ